MFGIFRRHRLIQNAGICVYPYTFFTVCKWVRPMSLAEYELSEQSLDNVSDWLDNSRAGRRSSHDFDYHHYSIRPNCVENLQTSLSRCFSMQSVPVIFSNCHETLLDVVASLLQDGGTLGVLDICKSFNLKPSLELCYGSAFQFLLSKYDRFGATYLGIDAQCPDSEQQQERAADFGCDWLTLDEYRLKHKSVIQEKVAHYLNHYDQSILVVDLDSLHPKHELDNKVIDISMVLKTIEQCMASDQLRLIMLVGRRDNAIYSRETKAIYQQIKTLSAQVFER